MIYIKTNELYHHGILGQKWGVKKGPPYPLGSGDHSAAEKKAGWQKSLDKSSEREALRNGRNKLIAEQDGKPGGSRLTPEQKKKIAKVALTAAAAVGVTAAVYLAYKSHAVDSIDDAVKAGVPYSQMKDVLSKSFSETGGVLKEGDVVHRMVGFADFDVKKAGSNLFVSGAEKDRVFYANFLKDFSGTGKRYDVALQATKDIKIPSKAEAEKIFNSLYTNDPLYKNKLIDTMTEIYKAGGISEGVARETAKIKIRQDPFLAAVTGIAKDTPATRQFVGELKNKGFGAIADYHDIMDKITDTPLIVFDPQNTMKKIGEEFVNKQYKIAGMKGLKKSGITSILGTPIDFLIQDLAVFG